MKGNHDACKTNFYVIIKLFKKVKQMQDHHSKTFEKFGANVCGIFLILSLPLIL